MSIIIRGILKTVTSPIALFILSAIIIVVYSLRAKTNFYNVKKVFSDYLRIFSRAKSHLLFFWGVPALMAFALVQVTPITTAIANNLLVFLSILIAGFFSMLSILVTQQGNNTNKPAYKTVLIESATIVLLEVILCISALIIILAILTLESYFAFWILFLFSLLEYYLIFVMLFNILVLVKRIKALIDNA